MEQYSLREQFPRQTTSAGGFYSRNCSKLFVPFRLKRLVVLMDPGITRITGYKVVKSLIAVGGRHSRWLCCGKQKLFFLPFAHSDFNCAIVSEELGLVGRGSYTRVCLLFCGVVCVRLCGRG